MKSPLQFNLSVGTLFVLSAIVGCGNEAPPSNANRVMNEYFWGTFDTGCVPMSERSDFTNMAQRASLPMGLAYIDRHNVQPANWNNGAFSEKGELSGEIERVVYHDTECKEPGLKIRIPLRGGSTYVSTDGGIRLQVEPIGTIVAVDEKACRYLFEQFDWEKLDMPEMNKKCEVGASYDRGDKRFQPSRIERYPNLTRVSVMPFEINYVDSKVSRLNVRAPRDFFANIFNWVAEFDFGPSPSASEVHALTGTKRAGAP